jgi:hypothetical protein
MPATVHTEYNKYPEARTAASCTPQLRVRGRTTHKTTSRGADCLLPYTKYHTQKHSRGADCSSCYTSRVPRTQPDAERA